MTVNWLQRDDKGGEESGGGEPCDGKVTTLTFSAVLHASRSAVRGCTILPAEQSTQPHSSSLYG